MSRGLYRYIYWLNYYKTLIACITIFYSWKMLYTKWNQTPWPKYNNSKTDNVKIIPGTHSYVPPSGWSLATSLPCSYLDRYILTLRSRHVAPSSRPPKHLLWSKPLAPSRGRHNKGNKTYQKHLIPKWRPKRKCTRIKSQYADYQVDHNKTCRLHRIL